MPHHAVMVSEALDQLFDVLQGLRRHADMHHIRVHQADGPQPGGAPARVRDQLGLVDHRGLEMAFAVAELYRGGDNLGVFHLDGFLSGQHAAGDAGGVDFVVHLQRQQAQRSQIGPGDVLLQVFDGVKGLAAVGRPDVQDKAALHLPGPLHIAFRRIGLEDLPDLRNLLLLVLCAALLLQGFRDFGMLDGFLHLLPRPHADVPVGAVSHPDGLKLRFRKVAVDLVLRHAVFLDDLPLREQSVTAAVCSLFASSSSAHTAPYQYPSSGTEPSSLDFLMERISAS